MGSLIITNRITFLTDLATSIESEHQEILLTARSGLEHARKAGELLLKAKQAVKDQIGHGYWSDWVIDSLSCSHRTAQAYMQIATSWELIVIKAEEKAQDLALFGIEGALRLIAKAKTEAKKEKLPPQNQCRKIPPLPEATTSVLRLHSNEANEEKSEPCENERVEPDDEHTSTSIDVFEVFQSNLDKLVQNLNSLAERATSLPLSRHSMPEIQALIEEGRKSLTRIEMAVPNCQGRPVRKCSLLPK